MSFFLLDFSSYRGFSPRVGSLALGLEVNLPTSSYFANITQKSNVARAENEIQAARFLYTLTFLRTISFLRLIAGRSELSLWP